MLRNVSNFLSTNITTGRVTIPLTVFPLKCSWWDCDGGGRGGGDNGDDNDGGGGEVDSDDDGNKGNATDVEGEDILDNAPTKTWLAMGSVGQLAKVQTALTSFWST